MSPVLDRDRREEAPQVPGLTIPALQCRHLGSLLAMLTLLGLSCVTQPSQNFSYANGIDNNGRPRPQRLLVLPLNITIPVPDVLESTTGNVLGMLVGFLRDRGNSIELLEPDRARDLWRASVLEVEESTTLERGYKSAIQVFIARIGASTSFDALIMPTLVFRDSEIKVNQRQVKWDGVIRRYDVVNYSEQAKKMNLATAIFPTIPGVSFHLVIRSPTGDLILSKFGGLDIAHDVSLKKSEITMTSDLVRREHILADTDYLREGIAVAFDPYFPRD